ncbi:DUF1206 domain-containing protein [Falsibacillus pallidus]|uniref:DUF1206 domain-containing protein n=1 Tax=Falsibacillus pallidus TaxID=493781 RepID=UPI003D966DC3
MNKAHKTEKQKDKARPWIRKFARFGYFAKGFVYILIGILTMMAAIGVGGNKKGAEGAFASVAKEPYGEILLWIIAVGLVCYVGWRIIQVFIDPEDRGFGIKGLGAKIGYFISGAIYAGLTYKAVKIAMHAGSSGSDSKKTVMAKLIQHDWGQLLIGLLGAGIALYGLYQFYFAYKEKFAERFKKYEMSAKELKLGLRTGKLGLASRGIVFCMIGYFLIQTALTAKPDEATDLDGALLKISQQPFGQWLLGLLAIGLLLYGVFQIVKGKNRNMRVL